MVERIGPKPDGDDKTRKSSKIDADHEAFEELMRIDKAKEVEYEERKKKKFILGEEEEDIDTQPKAPPPSQVYYYKKSETESTPDLNIKDTDVILNPQNVDTENNKIYPTPQKEKPILDEYQIAKKLKERKELEKKAKISAEKEKAKETKIKEKAIKLEKDKHKKEKEKDFAQKQNIQLDINNKIVQLDQVTLEKANAIATKVESFTSPEMQPLLQAMIGTIIKIENNGISQTQIILNSKEFENSRFFNTEILFEKYATAPNSYNITLSGNNEAVTIFNRNIEGLYKALKASNLDFDLGRVSAIYKTDRPLFQRKKPIKDMKDDSNKK